MATEAVRAIEAILMVADRPVEPHLLAQLLEVSPDRVDELCAELAEVYEAEERGFALVKVAGGYRYQSHPDLAPYVERFVLEGQSSRLSAAALETLAIVAYKQPISRAQVSAIRGVDVDGVMRTLQQRGYIDEIARDAGPGQAVLFGTTEAFLEKMGLYSLDDLPALGEFVPDARVVEALEAGLRPDPLPEVAEAQAAVDPTLAPSTSASTPTDVAPDEPAVTDAAATGELGTEAPLGSAAPPAPADDAGRVDPGAGPRADG